MGFDSFDGGADNEFTTVGWVGISKTFVTQGGFFQWANTFWQSVEVPCTMGCG